MFELSGAYNRAQRFLSGCDVTAI